MYCLRREENYFNLFYIKFFLQLHYLVRQNPESEKLSAYECGYEPYEDARHTVDITFCVVAILLCDDTI